MTDLLLLSRRPGGYTARRLLESARALGFRARAVAPQSLQVGLGTGVEVRRRGVKLGTPQALTLRCGVGDLAHALTVAEALQGLGARSLNRLEVLAALRAPLWALTRLAAAGIPVLPAVTLGPARSLDRAIYDVGGLPVTLQSSAPGKDLGTVVGRTRAGTRAAAQVLLQWNHGVTLQRAAACSYRVIVVNGACVAALQQAPQLAVARIPAGVTALAERAAALLALDVAGVDVAMEVARAWALLCRKPLGRTQAAGAAL